MITIIEGIPGSGKTYFAVRELLQGEHYYYQKVYTNIKMNLPYLKLKYPEFYHKLEFISAKEIENLGKWAENKSNCLIILDEIQIYYNSREWQKRNKDFLEFLTQHRKQGIDLWVITQDKKNIDTQFRRLAGIIVQCVNASQLEVFIFRLPNLFIAKKFTGGVRAGTEIFRLNKKIAFAYDTFARVDLENQQAKAKKLPLGLRIRRAIIWHKFARFVSYLIVFAILWFKYGHYVSFSGKQKKVPRSIQAGTVSTIKGVAPLKVDKKNNVSSIINDKTILGTLQPFSFAERVAGVVKYPDGSIKFLIEKVKTLADKVEKSYKWIFYKPFETKGIMIDYTKGLLKVGNKSYDIGGYL